jgi:hypothetical protein
MAHAKKGGAFSPVSAIETPQPGRVTSEGGINLLDEREFSQACTSRASKGYNSGMGEIFRKVSALFVIHK